MRKFISKFILIFIFTFLTSFSGIHVLDAENVIASCPDNQIRLGTFNIEKLGKANEYQARNAAEILKNYDIVAIQEVMNTGATRKNHIGKKGKEALQQIVAYLGDDWAYVVSSEPNGTARAEQSRAFNTFEYYAFIYRKSKAELIPDSNYLWDEDGNSMHGLKDQERQFDREPFIASFKSKNGNLDFTLITIHAASPSAGWRRDEIRRLKVVYETVQDSDAKQNDVFLLGDFNTSVDKKEWESVKSLPGMRHILTSSNVTTLDKARGRLSKNQYDTIWYQAEYSDEDMIAETADAHEAWRESIEMPDDVRLPRSIESDENRKIWLYGKYVSDHLPVTILLWVDKDTDNFKETIIRKD